MVVEVKTRIQPGELEARTTKVTIIPYGDPLFHERATSIEIVDEAAGEYLVIRQCKDALKEFEIDRVEWPILKKTIDDMIEQCRS